MLCSATSSFLIIIIIINYFFNIPSVPENVKNKPSLGCALGISGWGGWKGLMDKTDKHR